MLRTRAQPEKIKLGAGLKHSSTDTPHCGDYLGRPTLRALSLTFLRALGTDGAWDYPYSIVTNHAGGCLVAFGGPFFTCVKVAGGGTGVAGESG